MATPTIIVPGVAAAGFLGRPQGTLQRTYNFPSDTQSWVAGSGQSLSQVAGPPTALQQVSSSEGSSTEPIASTAVADGELYTRIRTTGDGGLHFRCTDANNCYLLRYASGGVFRFYKKVSGSYTQLGSDINQSEVIGNAWTNVLIRFVGSTITCYVNDTLICAVSDTTYSTGFFGIRGLNGTLQITDYRIYTLPSSWTELNVTG
jgi:hypothetical protein